MNKATRIKAFVDLERINGSTIVKNSTSLFQNLLQNVKREYKKFHEMKDPKMTIISSKPNIELLSDTGSFLDKEDFIKSFIEVKRSYELPFAITQEIQCSKNFEPSSVVFSSQKLFRTLYFVSSAFSREVFYQTQRQHKIWWMKFGSSPGKYSISDQKSESFAKFVTIKSNVESPIDVERISTFTIKDCIKDKEVLKNFMSRLPNRKREVVPDVIEVVVDFNVAAYAFLLDAVDLSNNYTALHRRSAPFQIAIIANETSKDLVDLARFIELLIHETDPRIRILNKSTEDFNALDSIGVPYAIVLDEQALESGMFKLRNRNTTLSETIHLSDVNNYLIKIFDAT